MERRCGTYQIEFYICLFVCSIFNKLLCQLYQTKHYIVAIYFDCVNTFEEKMIKVYSVANSLSHPVVYYDQYTRKSVTGTLLFLVKRCLSEDFVVLFYHSQLKEYNRQAVQFTDDPDKNIDQDVSTIQILIYFNL